MIPEIIREAARQADLRARILRRLIAYHAWKILAQRLLQENAELAERVERLERQLRDRQAAE